MVRQDESDPGRNRRGSHRTFRLACVVARPKGKGQSCFHDRPLLMPATTYAPTHLARAVPSALRGLTSVFGMGTGGSPAVRSPTNRSSVVSPWPFARDIAANFLSGQRSARTKVPRFARDDKRANDNGGSTGC